MIKCPEKCLVCGAEWQGGSVQPGEPVVDGLRSFYNCGASLSIGIYYKDFSETIKPNFSETIKPNFFRRYELLFKGCQNDE